jgi:transglutaminase-like putative cysteine protease
VSQGRGGTAAFLAVMLLMLGLAGLGVAFVRSNPDVFTSATGPSTEGSEDAEAFHRIYRWDYAGKRWEIKLDIPRSAYDHYASIDRKTLSTIELDEGKPQWRYAYEDFVSDPGDDTSIQAIADELQRLGRKQGWSDDRILSFTLTFVQSMPYTADDVTTRYDEYPRFPIETLVDNGGDCEDTSILYASLILAMGYGAALVSPPGHMAVGVLADDGVPGQGYRHDGQWYLYAETTGDGYGIGEMPEAYRDEKADLYPLR